MSKTPLLKRIRLLPLVVVLAGGMLALKGADLIQIARAEAAPSAAEDATAAEAQTEAAPTNAAADPATADDSADSAAELQVLTSLSKRRAEIDRRAKELDMRANLLTAAEKRIDGKIADLKALETQIQGLLAQRDEAEKKQIAALVKVYSAMKPRDAGRIFNSLDEEVLIEVASAMKSDSLAAVMSAMNPQQAQDLTVKLANRLRPPKKPDVTPQAVAAMPPPPSPSTTPAVAPPPAAPMGGAANAAAGG